MLKNIFKLLILTASCSFLAFSSGMDKKRPHADQPETETVKVSKKPKSVVNYMRGIASSVFGYLGDGTGQNAKLTGSETGETNRGEEFPVAQKSAVNLLDAVIPTKVLQTIIADYVGVDLILIKTVETGFQMDRYSSNGIALSPDGNYAIGFSGNQLQEWDVQTGAKTTNQTIKSPNVLLKKVSPPSLNALVYCPNSQNIALAYDYCTRTYFDNKMHIASVIEIRDRKNWKLLKEKKFDGSITALQYSSDGKSLFFSTEFFLQELDAQTLQERRLFRGALRMYPFALSPDGKQVISAKFLELCYGGETSTSYLDIFDISKFSSVTDDNLKKIKVPGQGEQPLVGYISDYVVYISGDFKTITFLRRDDYTEAFSFPLLKKAKSLVISANGLIAILSDDATISFYRLQRLDA